jgi:hypothetical protein
MRKVDCHYRQWVRSLPAAARKRLTDSPAMSAVCEQVWLAATARALDHLPDHAALLMAVETLVDSTRHLNPWQKLPDPVASAVSDVKEMLQIVQEKTGKPVWQFSQKEIDHHGEEKEGRCGCSGNASDGGGAPAGPGHQLSAEVSQC